MKVLIVIPARMSSQRFLGKPLAMAAGKPLVEWTYLQAKTVLDALPGSQLAVTSPDLEVLDFCQKNNIPVVDSSISCPTGTHRTAEAFDVLDGIENGFHAIVNWQVDEPLVQPEQVIGLASMIVYPCCSSLSVYSGYRCGCSRSLIWTLVGPTASQEELANENVVKVIVSNNQCLWFSRAALRGARTHCGVYVYEPETLRLIARQPPTEHSVVESLEQLSWIENMLAIRPFAIPQLPLSINTPEDFEKFRQIKEASLECKDNQTRPDATHPQAMMERTACIEDIKRDCGSNGWCSKESVIAKIRGRGP